MKLALRALLKYFLRGLLVVAPIALTLWILWRSFLIVDRFVPLPDSPWVRPGAGFVLVVAVVTFIGLLTTNLLAAQAIELGQRLLGRVPFVKLVYTSIRDLTEAFVGEKRMFDRPVLVAFPEGAHVVGFVTRADVTKLGLADRVAVYVPQSYTMAGNLLIVPRERLSPLALPPGEAMAFVVSGGLTSVAAE